MPSILGKEVKTMGIFKRDKREEVMDETKGDDLLLKA